METIEDILRDMREEGHTGPSCCLEWVGAKMRAYAERIEAAHNKEMEELAESKRTFLEKSEASLKKALCEAYAENRHYRRLLHPKEDGPTKPTVVDIAHDMSRQAKAYECEVKRYGNTNGHVVGYLRDTAEKLVDACARCPVDTYHRMVTKLKKEKAELLAKQKSLAERIRSLLLYFDNKGDMTVGYLNESDEISSEILGVKPLYDTTEGVK